MWSLILWSPRLWMTWLYTSISEGYSKYCSQPGPYTSYVPQVIQHCFWTDLREQRPNRFSLSQKREDMVSFLQTGPLFVLHSCILHFLSVSGLEIFSQRLFGITAKSFLLTQLTARCCWPPPQLTEHFSQSSVFHQVHGFKLHGSVLFGLSVLLQR